MALYPPNGSLTTDKRVVDDTTTWDAQSDWTAYQSESSVEIVNGSVQITELAADLHARWDATELSLSDQDAVSTWPDETGNGYDLTAGDAPTFIASGINGNPVVSFNGSSNMLSTSFSNLSQPNHIFAVMQFRSIGSNLQVATDGNTSSNRNAMYETGTGRWGISGGSGLTGGTSDTSVHIWSGLYNGTSSDLRIDGSSIASGDAGTGALDGFRVGAENDNTSYAAVNVGEILIYPQDKSSIETEIESYLSDKWGITI